MNVSLSGADVIKIDDRILNDLADGDAVHLTSPNDLANVKVSKNGNMIFAMNNTGLQVLCTVRLLLGSADDNWLNSRLQEMKNDFSSFILLSGVFTKRVGDGVGKLSSAVYMLAGGIFKRQPEAKTSGEGDTEQSVVVYELLFGNGTPTRQ